MLYARIITCRCGNIFFFNNKAFIRFNDSGYKYVLNIKDHLKIRIVYKKDGWIFEKFALKLQEELLNLGQEVDVEEIEDPLADVNHYISYGRLLQIPTGWNTIRTTMITHIDSLMKRDLIKFQSDHNVLGICMSLDTVNKLSALGIPREKLCYINPAQDGEMKPKKIVLGITNRCYHNFDMRKRDDTILQICRQLDADYFKLKIMGSGWEEIVDEIRKLGFEIEYYNEFDKSIYLKLMPSLDYWIYYGFDEGAMGYLDAMAAGVKTIATPQGYHLDTKYGLTYPCDTIDSFVKVLQQIQNEKCQISIFNKAVELNEYTVNRQKTQNIESLKEIINLMRAFQNKNIYIYGYVDSSEQNYAIY